MQSPSNPPGYLQPTTPSLPPGAQNPRHAAFLEQQTANAKTLQIAQLAKGGGSSGNPQIAVPQMHMQYKPVGDSPVQISANAIQQNMQLQANAAYDQHATTMGGRRRRRRTQSSRRKGSRTRGSRRKQSHRRRRRRQY